MPVQVPKSPLVHPPAGAEYVPLIDFWSEDKLPRNVTIWPFSFSVKLNPDPDIDPAIAADDAQGLPDNATNPESVLPDCVSSPVAFVVNPNGVERAVKFQNPEILV